MMIMDVVVAKTVMVGLVAVMMMTMMMTPGVGWGFKWIGDPVSPMCTVL